MYLLLVLWLPWLVYRGDRDREKSKDRSRDRDDRSRDKSRDRDRGDRKKRRNDKDRERSTGGRDGSDGEEEQEGGRQGGVDLTADLTPEEIQMMQAMGIPFSFDTTQGKMVSVGGRVEKVGRSDGSGCRCRWRTRRPTLVPLRLPARASENENPEPNPAFLSPHLVQVEDEAANVSAIKTTSVRSARQYMNRRGGFNRPLPAEKTNEKVARD